MHTVIIRSERLLLRLADPASDEDCRAALKFYQSPNGEEKSKSFVNSIEDVRTRQRTHGPKARFCTRSEPPYGHIFLVFLPKTTGEAAEKEEGLDLEGTHIGAIGMAFREVC